MEIPSLPEGGLIATVMLIAICLNVLLSAVSKILDLIKDKTSTDLDNKASGIVQKVVVILTKAIDFIGMNRPHK